MTANNKFFSLFPSVMDENQFVVFAFLIGKIKDKKGILKVEDKELESALKGNGSNGIGRDLVQGSLTWLHANKYIVHEQKRDTEGKFAYNNIRIISNLVS